jgi:hypothetical protein
MDGMTGTQTRRLRILGALTLPLLCNHACRSASAQLPASRVVVRLAELEIDPAHLESDKAFLREEIETSIRVEPGVELRSADPLPRPWVGIVGA